MWLHFFRPAEGHRNDINLSEDNRFEDKMHEMQTALGVKYVTYGDETYLLSRYVQTGLNAILGSVRLAASNISTASCAHTTVSQHTCTIDY